MISPGLQNASPRHPGDIEKEYSKLCQERGDKARLICCLIRESASLDSRLADLFAELTHSKEYFASKRALYDEIRNHPEYHPDGAPVGRSADSRIAKEMADMKAEAAAKQKAYDLVSKDTGIPVEEIERQNENP